MRKRIVLGSILGAIAIHLAFIACSGPDRSGDGGIIDAARDVIIGESGDAHAQSMPMEAQCSQAQNGFFFAQFSIPGFDPANAGEITARVCNLTCTMANCGFSRPSGSTDYQCVQGASIALASGRVDVYCGTAGDRGQSARLWIH